MGSGRLQVVYATDENIAIRAAGDFAALVPQDQTLARGTDGVISGGSPWVLTSASVNFATQGVAAGMVCVVTQPGNRANYGTEGDRFAVDSVSGSNLTLRRLGQPSATGQPAAPAAGLTGLTFAVRTFYPQIEEESWEINERYGISELSARGRTPGDLFDNRDLRKLCVLTVLRNLYVAQARGAGPQGSEWWAKANALAEEIGRTEARLAVRWGNGAEKQVASTTSSARITR